MTDAKYTVGLDANAIRQFLLMVKGAVADKEVSPNFAEKVEELIEGITVNETPKESPDANVERNRKMLLDRSVFGLAKYGVTTERTDLDLPKWLQHILEELLDAANYVQAAKMQIERDKGAQYQPITVLVENLCEACIDYGAEREKAIISSHVPEASFHVIRHKETLLAAIAKILANSNSNFSVK